MQMFEQRLVLGLDPKPPRVKGHLTDPAFGITIGEKSFPSVGIVEALEQEMDSWRPLECRADFVLALCLNDPFWDDALDLLTRKGFCLSTHLGPRVAAILDLASKIMRRNLRRERANLLAFMARWDDDAPHSIGTMARAWALHLAREQLYQIQTEEWHDFFYDDYETGPVRPARLRP